MCVCQRGSISKLLCPHRVCMWSGGHTVGREALGGAWSHSANGAAGTASESIRPHYSSCSATVHFFFPPLLLSVLTRTLPSFPPPPVHAANPVWHVTDPLPALEHTSCPQRERPSQLAALTLIDLAPVLTLTPGETFSEREAWIGAGMEPSRMDGG